ncbi:predicted protein [Uncinocarpus reesii 1704]|uniref:Uncharacterized protein n=1 Tax=Uncinocarpus reesii (strain UAMH 1704) TaxID=336963 RepID=C4JM21_UNCRE|nr:uncharacterized protein UREG_03879 [Uncinocarpus reesii 1704]EEP79033.1 predicted protein [Uncinocarpus reesii 1704]
MYHAASYSAIAQDSTSRHATTPMITPIPPTTPMMKTASLPHGLGLARISLRRSGNPQNRNFSTPPKPPATPDARGRFERFNGRLPPFLRKYTAPLLRAPVMHITSFLILHEITAVVPLFGLVGLFHYGGWMPSLGNGEGDSAFDEGVRKFGKWLRKRGWVENEMTKAEVIDAVEQEEFLGSSDVNTNQGMRLILEFATAYAVTKALLPMRIMISAWATPWFAKCVLVPLRRGVGRLFGNSKRR